MYKKLITATLSLLAFSQTALAEEHNLNGASSHAHKELCKSVSTKEIAALFDRWNNSLKTGDPEKVVENYADSSVLLPTLSNKLRLTKTEKLEYFEHFLAKKPIGTIDTSDIELDCNTAFDAGIYHFTFADGSVAMARYTYTYKWDSKQKRWLITSHHSSLMPEKETTISRLQP